MNIYALIGEILPSAFRGVVHVTSWRERVLALWNFTSAKEGDSKTRTQVMSHLKGDRAVMRPESGQQDGEQEACGQGSVRDRGARRGNGKGAGRFWEGGAGFLKQQKRVGHLINSSTHSQHHTHTKYGGTWKVGERCVTPEDGQG